MSKFTNSETFGSLLLYLNIKSQEHFCTRPIFNDCRMLEGTWYIIDHIDLVIIINKMFIKLSYFI